MDQEKEERVPLQIKDRALHEQICQLADELGMKLYRLTEELLRDGLRARERE